MQWQHVLQRGMAGAALAACSLAAAAADAQWLFDVRLDARAIGQHRFALTAQAEGRRLTSEAQFDVRMLGIPLYRYRHQATERWQGDCLAALQSSTDDDGRSVQVQGEADGGRFRLAVREGAEGVRRTEVDSGGCLMSFAYWNPRLAGQRQLLNPATGKVEAVTVEALPEQMLEVAGRPTAVRGLRIGGLARPIDVWYADGRWVGLDSTVDGGRRLSYRLRP